MRCHTCKKECSNPKRCSRCKKTAYCSKECQISDWKAHKRGVCALPPRWNETEKLMRKINGPNSVFSRISGMENMAWEERRQNPVATPTQCDGCFRRFRGIPPRKEDGETEATEDCGEVEKRCRGCDWTICKDCSLPEYQRWDPLNRPTGTCRCFNSNFGESYCSMTPSHFHGDQSQHYYGDRHPDIAASGYSESAFEAKDRTCRTCGEVARCLRKEHLKDLAPGL